MKKLFTILLATIAGVIGFAQCDGSHNAMDDMSWLSCTGTENPNNSRIEEHWIMYDLGGFYHLGESHFWNYNQAGDTENGIATIAIDYSVDGVNWTWWGDLNLDEAPGSDSYYGEEGPDFDGLLTKYLLLTVVANHGGPCYGFSEMKIDAEPGVQDVDEPTVQAFEFGLHPNPAKDLASVQIENGFGSQLTLYSPTGQIVRSIYVTTQVTRIDLTDFAPGVYLVEVVGTDGPRATQRLTVVN